MKRNYKLILTFATLISGFLIGLIGFVIAGAIPMFASFNISDNPWLIGLVASSVILGIVIGILTAKMVSKKMGRKSVIMLSTTFFILSSVISAFYINHVFFIIARIFGGVGAGFLLVIIPITVCEFTNNGEKAKILDLFQKGILSGILFVLVANFIIVTLIDDDEVAWKLMFCIIQLPAAILALVFINFPESPVWLYSKNRINEARRSYNNYTNDYLSESEFKQYINRYNILTEKTGGYITKERSTVVLVLVFIFLYQLSGISVILLYSPVIVCLTGVQLQSSFLAAILFGVIYSFISMGFWRFLGRIWGRYQIYLGLLIIFLSLLMVSFTFSKAYLRIDQASINKVSYALQSEMIKRNLQFEDNSKVRIDSVLFGNDEAKIYRNGIIIQKLKYSEELINEGILEAEFITEILRKYEGVDFFEGIGFFKKIRSRLLAELIFHVNSNKDSRNDFAFSDEIIHKRSSRISTYETANEILNSRFNLYRTVLLEHALNINNTLLIISLAGAFLGFSVSMGGSAHAIYHSVFSNLSYDTGNLLVLVFNGVIYFLLVFLFPIEVQKFGFRGTFLIYAFIVTVLLIIILINNKNSRIKALFENNTEDENNKSNY